MNSAKVFTLPSDAEQVSAPVNVKATQMAFANNLIAAVPAMINSATFHDQLSEIEVPVEMMTCNNRNTNLPVSAHSKIVDEKQCSITSNSK
jgi:hypothetical protein